MILDTLSNSQHYSLGPAFTQAIDFIRSLDSQTPDGDYSIDGKKVYASIMSYTSKIRETARFEAHRRYADIQAVLDGQERICIHPTDQLALETAYDEERDLLFLTTPDEPTTDLVMRPGSFAFLLPQDAHMPMVALKAPSSVKKVVVKIALNQICSSPIEPKEMASTK